jgi:uncharacterized protein (DUF305 family)
MGRSFNRAVMALALIALPVAVVAQSDESGRDVRRTLYVDAHAAMEFALDAIYATMTRVEPAYSADMKFALGTIPFQRAIIDMAVVVLETGDDPEVAALAEEILAVQEDQMARLQALAAVYTRVDE